MSAYLTADQVDQMLAAINPVRVSQRDGMSHLEAYDVRAHLNRIFGFARWSADLIDLTMLFETLGTRNDGREIVSVGYRATVRLAVFSSDGTFLASYTEAATGDAVNFPINKRADAADFAIKTAESQALKRCAINLGDQFGLSLYAKGNRAALVKRTLVHPGADSAPNQPVDHDAEAVTPEIVDPPVAQVESTVAPPPPAPSPEQAVEEAPIDPEQDVELLRAAVLKARTMHRRDALPALGKINVEAGRRKLLQRLVTDENGEAKTVGAFINDSIAMVMTPKASGAGDKRVAS